jgi:hypothetical protein
MTPDAAYQCELGTSFHFTNSTNSMSSSVQTQSDEKKGTRTPTAYLRTLEDLPHSAKHGQGYVECLEDEFEALKDVVKKQNLNTLRQSEKIMSLYEVNTRLIKEVSSMAETESENITLKEKLAVAEKVSASEKRQKLALEAKLIKTEQEKSALETKVFQAEQEVARLSARNGQLCQYIEEAHAEVKKAKHRSARSSGK